MYWSNHESKTNEKNIFLPLYIWLALDNEGSKCIFDFTKDPSKGYVNNTETHYEFKFDKILDQTMKQEPVFETVAKDVFLIRS